MATGHCSLEGSFIVSCLDIGSHQNAENIASWKKSYPHFFDVFEFLHNDKAKKLCLRLSVFLWICIFFFCEETFTKNIMFSGGKKSVFPQQAAPFY
jgi:hypothetical protein